MGGAIARGAVTSPLVTSSPATQGVTSGSVVGPPGVTPSVANPDIDEYGLLTANISSTLVINNTKGPYLNLAGDRVYFARTSGSQSTQYELTTPGDLASLTGNFELVHTWLAATQFMKSITLTPDRTKCYKIRQSSSSTDTIISADPFSAAEMGDVSGGNPYQLTNTKISPLIVAPVTPGALVAAPNNLDLFMQSADAGDRGIYHFQMSVAGDASTVTALGEVLDLDAKFATLLYWMVYTPDGSKLFVLGDDSGTIKIVQFDLSTAYDVTTAVDSGKELVVTPAQTARLSLGIWENPAGGFKLYLTSMPNVNGTDLRVDTYESPFVKDLILIDDGGDELLIDDATSDNRLIED